MNKNIDEFIRDHNEFAFTRKNENYTATCDFSMATKCKRANDYSHWYICASLLTWKGNHYVSKIRVVNYQKLSFNFIIIFISHNFKLNFELL